MELEIQEKYIGQQGRCKCCNQVFTAQPQPDEIKPLPPINNQGSSEFVRSIKKGCLYSFILVGITFGMILIISMLPSQPSQQRKPSQSHQQQSGTPARKQSQSSTYTLTADQLYSEFDANEVAAEAKYKKQIVTVSGVIQDIGTEILGRAYVIIGGRGFLDGVQCVFPDSEKPRIAVLSKGQHITIRGTVTGKMGNIIITDASLQ